MSLVALFSLGVAYGACSGWNAWARYRALQLLDASPAATPLRDPGADPSVSIVIPARNEAHNLPRLLRSVARQRHPHTEVIVVDDASEDGSGALAAAHGARVITLREDDRPPDWLGKPNACQRGAEAATGDWLLFLDADTELSPEAVSAAVCYASRHHLDALSLMPRQRCESFWERLLLPYAFQQFFAGVDPRRVVDPSSREALLNGQFILIRSSTYRSTGGHGTVRWSIVEDVALARVLKRAGKRIETVRGERYCSVRMYHDIASIRAGFGKNAYAFLADEPWRGAKVALSSTCAGLVGPIFGSALLMTGRRRTYLLVLALLSWVSFGVGLLGWVRRFGVPAWYAALQPVASLVFQAIATESTIRSVLGTGVNWKGRSYRVGLVGASNQAPHLLHPRLPLSLLPELSLAIVTGRRHSLHKASAAMAQAMAGQWQVEGIDRIPAVGPVCLVSNHWQRPGLWIGWVGGLLGWLVSQRRPTFDPPVHWLVTTETRLSLFGIEWHVSVLDVLLRRVAHVWSLVPVDPSPRALGRRATALRTLRSLAAKEKVIGIFPEGHRGIAGPLGEPVPGTERVLAWLQRQGVTLVPVAVFETEGGVITRIGRPIDDLSAEEANAETIMCTIAALLPPELRGRYATNVASP
jgi:chlorobactene glucosyltransferase